MEEADIGCRGEAGIRKSVGRPRRRQSSIRSPNRTGGMELTSFRLFVVVRVVVGMVYDASVPPVSTD